MMDELPVFSVSDLTSLVKGMFQETFPMVAVQGEISNFHRARSGHVYFTLKDAESQLRVVIWRNTASRIRFDMQDGLEVIAAGSLDVYAVRGEYHLVVKELIPQGIGPLELAFRQLQQKLAAEGLFDEERKQPLPALPAKIALITSPTSAAVRDMIQVITRRWPLVDLLVVPVLVQGETAAAQISRALTDIVRVPDVDLVIVGRGGGSLEDLWPFNTETVARAIAACPLPVVSAVGHEIDVTIADFVADYRALTPSEAGELVVPDFHEFHQRLLATGDFLETTLRERITQATMQLDGISLQNAMRKRYDNARRDVQNAAGMLHALSPLRILERGYTITRHEVPDQPSPATVTTINELEPGETLETLFADGRVQSRIERIVNSPFAGNTETPSPIIESRDDESRDNDD